VVVLSPQCFEWLVSTLEVLLGLPDEQDFVKFLREGSKILIARRCENKAGHFLEASSFGMGGQKGFILIPEGRRGWGWHKFSGELRKAVDYFSDLVGCGLGSSSTSEMKEGKLEGQSVGLAPKWTGLSFAEVVRSDPVNVEKALPNVRGRHSRSKISPVEPFILDVLPSVRLVEEELRSEVDCFSLESPPLELLDKVTDRLQHVRPLGKKRFSLSNSKFESLRLRTWRKLGSGFDLALGRAVRKVLGRFLESGLGSKCSGFRLARLMQKPRFSRPSSSPPEKTTNFSSGLLLVRSPTAFWRLFRQVQGRWLCWSALFSRSPHCRQICCSRFPLASTGGSFSGSFSGDFARTTLFRC
jgi:hypothetical protein